MQRPRWHDVVIVLALMLLATVGIGAIWGDSIAQMLDSDPPSAPAKQPDSPGSDLL